MVQELVGAHRLEEKAWEEGASYIVADTPGWVVEPAAQEFHVRMIDLLQPDVVVGFEKGPELEGILVNFRRHPRIEIFECSPPAEVVERKRDWRKLYRFQRFSEYFSCAVPHARFLSGLGIHGRIPESFCDDAWHNLLIALCDPEMMVVTLGLVDRLDLVTGTLSFRAPPHDVHKVASIHVGSIQVDYPVRREGFPKVPSQSHGGSRLSSMGENWGKDVSSHSSIACEEYQGRRKRSFH